MDTPSHTQEIPVPAGEVAKRTLHFFWLADCSGSMSGTKMATLNQSIREVLPEIAEVVKDHPQVRVEMRAIRFASLAEWHVGPSPMPLAHFTWPDLRPEGATATSQALRMLAQQLEIHKMPDRGLPPVCLLISDGFCTDSAEEYELAIQELDRLPWGMKAVRLAIAIGDESHYDEQELLKFVSPALRKEVGILKAHNKSDLLNHIKWASTAAVRSSSKSYVDESVRGENSARLHTNVVLGPPPAPQITDSAEVF
ncbi:vWA domain-containing protein [Candidatus Magnetaquicoccus inordinatus]|uniref:vWA domain-containing protein n=1 Tax=Candidatus Magnetaquicoccus inordinatus TaxID=2496818 RepID=UPI00102B841F|nr:vWA domain-containing protein [Candidatus Magnetaquicoccus inordinatus]